MADFREYIGVDFSSEFLSHYGVGHDKGGHSGRYPWGSGKDNAASRKNLTNPIKAIKEKYEQNKVEAKERVEKQRKVNALVKDAENQFVKQTKGKNIDEDKAYTLIRRIERDGYKDDIAKQLCRVYGIKATKENLNMIRILYDRWYAEDVASK